MSEYNTNESIETQGIPEITMRVEVEETVQSPVDDSLSVPGMAADAAAVGAALTELQATLEAAISALFPIGAVYGTASSEAPAFYGTWVEILVPMSQGDIEDGTRNFTGVAEGVATGTLHLWRRTA